MSDDPTIKPYRIERVCQSQADIGRLTLKPNVDTRERVYTRTLVELAGAGLPGGVNSQGGSPWDLYLLLRYRQEWRPNGYGLGDLLFTMSLLPNEELVLEVKTWETSKTQQDEEESTDARNVSDLKSSTSIAHELTTGRETTTKETASGSAGWSGFGFSASADAGWSSDVNQMQQSVAKQAKERTQQATNEYRTTHKVRMSVSREEGSEQKTTRRIRNVNQAHTLNANYFEVLQEYDVELVLDQITLVLLGSEPNLASPVGLNQQPAHPGVLFMRPVNGEFPTPHSQPPGGDTGLESIDAGLAVAPSEADASEPLTLAQLIRISHDPALSGQFITRYGISPVKLIRELWTQALRDSAIVAVDLGVPDASITDEARSAFVSKVLSHVRPSPGWVEPDRDGRLRWAYEVIPGRETSLLRALYSLLPFGVEQLRARARAANMDLREVEGAIVRRVEEVSILERRSKLVTYTAALVAEKSSRNLELIDNDRIYAPGPFHGMEIPNLDPAIQSWVDKIVGQLAEVRQAENPLSSWKATVPTQGVYADLSLGVCSGAEDYYEIQRQLELEQKKAEIERMKLENERLRLENAARQAGAPDLKLSGSIDRATVRVNVASDAPPRNIEIDHADSDG